MTKIIAAFRSLRTRLKMAAWLVNEANGQTLLAAQHCTVRCIVGSIELLSKLCDTAVDNTASLPH